MHLFCVLMVKHKCFTKILYDLDFWLSIHFQFFFFGVGVSSLVLVLVILDSHIFSWVMNWL